MTPGAGGAPVTTAPSPPVLPLAEQLTFLYEARATSAVLDASGQLGVFDRLGQGPVDAATLAHECRIGEEAAHALLTALVGLGLAQPDRDGAFRGVAGDVPGLLEILQPWEHLIEGLRHRPEVSVSAGTYSRIVRPLAAFWTSAAVAAVEHLKGAGRRVLDLGAGGAPWSLALAAADSDCEVTALDVPPVLEVTRQAVRAAGYEDQFRFIGADLFDVDLEQGAFDLVIVGNLCHLFDESDNRRLLARAGRWLSRQGTVAVIDLLPSERGDGPRGVTLYGLGLIQRTPAGQVYPFSSYVGWLRGTGYEKVERIELSSCPPMTLVRARRPG